MKIKLKIPKTWNELNIRQQKKIAFLLNSKSINKVLFDYKLLYTLLDLRWWQFFKYIKFRRLTKNVEFTELKQHYSWVYQEVELTTFLPKIYNKYLPPADRLSNFTVDEFAHTEDLFLGFCKTQNLEYLHYMTAILYRRKSKTRKVFIKENLEKEAQYFSILPKTILFHILLTYQGCRNNLIKQFPLIFPKTEETSGALPNNSGFGKLILHFSGGKFGTHNETKQTNLYTFLSEFEEQLKSKPYG